MAFVTTSVEIGKLNKNGLGRADVWDDTGADYIVSSYRTPQHLASGQESSTVSALLMTAPYMGMAPVRHLGQANLVVNIMNGKYNKKEE